MEQVNLADGTKLILKENVLALFSDKALKTASSAIFNGGINQVKAVLNVGVPEGYNDLSLHLDPLKLITSSAAKVGLTKDYLAMVTAAKVKNYSLFSKKSDIAQFMLLLLQGARTANPLGKRWMFLKSSVQ